MISFASDHADLLRGGRRAAWRDQGSQKRKFPDTHIRHALPREPLQSAMLSVAVPMVSRSFGTLLVAGIGLLVDQPLALLPARLTAVPLTVEITAADEEPPTAEPAEKLDEDREDVHPAAPNERKLDAPSRPRDPPLTRLRTRARFCRPKLRRALASFSPRCLSLDRPEAPREFQVTLPVPVPVANFPRILMAIDTIEELLEIIGIRGPTDHYPYHVLGSQILAWTRVAELTQEERAALLALAENELTEGSKHHAARAEMRALLIDVRRERLAVATGLK